MSGLRCAKRTSIHINAILSEIINNSILGGRFAHRDDRLFDFKFTMQYFMGRAWLYF